MEIREALLRENWQDMVEGEGVEKTIIRLKDASHFQESHPDLDPETVLMEVNRARSSVHRGHLDWQSIILYPVIVGDEYNMSRGYFHERKDSEDYIWCQSGEGLLMLMDRSGKCWCEELNEGSLHHVDEDVAIRFINISDKPLLVAHVFPSEGGMDFEAVKAQPFPCHIYDDEGEMCIRVDLPAHPEPEDEEEFTFADALK